MTRARRAAACASALAFAAAAWLAVATTDVPSFDAVRTGHRPTDVPLLDRHGTIVHELRTDPRERRLAWTPLSAIAPALVDAVIAAEDRRFRSHGGVDVRALAGAGLGRLAGRTRGASTITMQVAALVDPALARRGHGRTLQQKARQMRVALAIERGWSKDEILEAYLNGVAFRGELRGIAAAAAFLYGKAPHGLAASESLTLAALVRSPNAPASAVARRAAHIAAVRGSAADPAGLDAATARLGDPGRPIARAALAPHLARRLLAGARTAVASTLDAATQRIAEDALDRALHDLAGRAVGDGAVLVADNSTGDVLAWVGGGAQSKARFVDMARARRQPGSTLKPFLYGLAFERRLLTPASLVEDTPLALAVAGGLYRPRDYDTRFRGLVSARTALASSLNVPAVRTLGLVGGDAFVALLGRLGFAAATESGEYYGPALALGGADVTLEELVAAYRALANGGTWTPLRVTPSAPPIAPRPVFSAAAAFQVTDVLADRESRSATFGLESALATRFFTAVKTGTSKDMRDNWCLGFSERYTVGVWVGNASGAPMQDVSGVAGAAPVWLDIMTWLHRASPSTAPTPPAELVTAAVEFPDAVEPARRDWFARGTAPGARILAAGEPRIVAPVDGTIIALDPDIPDDRERVPLEVAGDVLGVRWRVDDVDLGPARGLTLWAPTAGTHVVRLIGADAIPLAAATVEVRGGRH